MFQVPCVWRLPLCRRPPLLDAQLKSRPHAVVVDQAVVAVLAAAVDHAAVVRCADDVEKENVAAVPDFFRESGRALNGRVSVAAAVVDAAAEAVADVAVEVVVDVAAEAVARSFAASLPAVAPEVAAVDVAVVEFSTAFAVVEVARQRQH